MRQISKYIAIVIFLGLSNVHAVPKLIVYLVYDQLRADILTLNKAKFLSAKSGNQLGGFNYLMQNGSYYPFAEYEVLSSMTCPGHAIISTGSWPIHMGIAINDWYSRSKKKVEYCVEDSEFGFSPRKLTTTTISDEFKGSDQKSKVFAIALKDRSAIMLGGHKADGAYWFDDKKWGWTTSNYYDKVNSAWLGAQNKKLVPARPEAELLKKIWGIQRTVDLAEAVVDQEKLGKTDGTDFLFISFSTHDMAGHMYGPNSEEMKKLIVDEDKELSRFLNTLKSKFNLEKDVLFVLTGDHGIPPTVDYSKKNKISAEFLNEIQFIDKIYKELNSAYDISDKKDWFKAIRSMHFIVNWDLVNKLKIDRKSFLEKVRSIIKNTSVAEEVIVPELYSKDLLMSPRLKRQIENSFIAEQWGDVILMPKPYSFPDEKGRKVDHVSGYTYDKMVPLIFVGAGFKKQMFYSKAYIVDIHPTIAAVLGVIPSPKVDGRILHEVLK
jgi:predicted AlkP superfamily pyrophosphatase or phosphodiesterase